MIDAQIDPQVWSRPALLKQLLEPRKDGYSNLALYLPNLVDAQGALQLEQQLTALDYVKRVDINLPQQRARITYHAAQISIAQLLGTCAQVGIKARPLEREYLHDPQQLAQDDALKRLLVAGIFGMQAMMFALVLYLDVIDQVETTTIQLFRWLGLLMATPVVGYAALPFFAHAWRDLKRKRPGIDVPIAIAIALIYLASAASTIHGQGEIWFDSACMLVFVLLLGRFLEQRIRHQHLQANTKQSYQTTLVTTRQRPDGKRETVAISEIEVDDLVHIAEGAIVPVDGVLESSMAHIDTSLFSGESDTQTRHQGDPIPAGSIALAHAILLRVTKTESDSQLSKLKGIIRRAGEKKASNQPTSKFIPWFIVGILSASLFTLIGWLWVDPAQAFDATIAVLVVTCPCAFALAIPATQSRAVSLLASHKLRVSRPQAITDLPTVTHALFDKTGTLSQSTIDSQAVTTTTNHSLQDLLPIALALATESTHPLSRLLTTNYPHAPRAQLHQIKAVPGHGVEGYMGDDHYYLGRPQTDVKADNGRALYLSKNACTLVRFPLHESPKPGAKQAITFLQKQAMHIEIVSGDAPSRVNDLAQALHIDTWFARQLPTDKYQHIEAIKKQGGKVMAMGDGSNDAAALARADVSISLIEATDYARHQADILISGSLSHLVSLYKMGQRARKTLWQSRAWGLAWNILAIPFAALGFIPPWLAALGMSSSSLIVILNVLRMRKLPPYN